MRFADATAYEILWSDAVVVELPALGEAGEKAEGGEENEKGSGGGGGGCWGGPDYSWGGGRRETRRPPTGPEGIRRRRPTPRHPAARPCGRSDPGSSPRGRAATA